MVRRLHALLLALLAVGVPGSARADLPLDDRRAHDDLFQWSHEDNNYGHNHFWVGVAESPNGLDVGTDLTDTVTRIEVTTYVPNGTGFSVRRFSGRVHHEGDEWVSPDVPGTEGFTEGPHYPDSVAGILFALPDDFGGVDAIVDVRLFTPRANVDCMVVIVGPCGGSTAGYVNYWPFIGNGPIDPDATDAIPEYRHLL